MGSNDDVLTMDGPGLGLYSQGLVLTLDAGYLCSCLIVSTCRTRSCTLLAVPVS